MAHRRTLELEELSPRLLPSATPVTLPVGPAALVTAITQQPRDLAGQGQGNYVGQSLVVDAGISDFLQGQADLVALGRVKIQGAVFGLGLVPTGHATGTLTFSNDDGSVTVALLGPLQHGFADLPPDWQYTVTSATGDYSKLRGEQGSLRLVLQADLVPAAAVGIFPRPRGTFQLTVDGGSAKAKPDSGIDGLALVGPMSPVDRLGVPNSKPLAGAVIWVEVAATGRVVVTVVTDHNGRFHANVAPGTYRLVPVSPGPRPMIPFGTPQTVVVKFGDDTDVTLTYDSGIR
jgi:hypothetical protein